MHNQTVANKATTSIDADVDSFESEVWWYCVFLKINNRHHSEKLSSICMCKKQKTKKILAMCIGVHVKKKEKEAVHCNGISGSSRERPAEGCIPQTE